MKTRNKQMLLNFIVGAGILGALAAAQSVQADDSCTPPPGCQPDPANPCQMPQGCNWQPPQNCSPPPGCGGGGPGGQGGGQGGPGPSPSPSASPSPQPPGSTPTDISDLSHCTQDAQYTVSPIDQTQLDFTYPLGALNPSGHTFPTDHIYFNYKLDANGNPLSGNVLAPGEIRITQAYYKQFKDGNGNIDHSDWSLYFYQCQETESYFHHINTLTQSILDQIGSFDPSQCNDGPSMKTCSKYVSINLHAGDLIGTAGGVIGLNHNEKDYSFDMGTMDSRVAKLVYANPDRVTQDNKGIDDFHVVCPLDYFSDMNGLKTSLVNTLGGRTDDSYGQVKKAMGSPVCGKVDQDALNTVQGKWFKDGYANNPEDPHLALAHDAVDPSLSVFSVGTTIPNLQSGRYLYRKQDAGLVNRDFPAIGVDGQIYCFENLMNLGVSGKVILQLLDGNTLKIEKQDDASCHGGNGLSFTANAVIYKR